MSAVKKSKSAPEVKAKLWPKLALLVLFVGVIVGFFAFGGQNYVNLATIKQNRDALLAYTSEHYVLALVVAFLVYSASTSFSLPGGLVLSLTIGMLFGRWVG